jgi:hypothetical protein
MKVALEEVPMYALTVAKIEKTRAPRGFLVIDHVERPAGQ